MTSHSNKLKIAEVKSRMIFDSRGFPTVEVDIGIEFKNEKKSFRSAVPSGASTGTHEALELRDLEQPFLGKGVQKALAQVQWVKESLLKKEFSSIEAFDSYLIELDGTENKSKLGANSILALSLSASKAFSFLNGLEYYQWISKNFQVSPKMPVPLMNVINGGAHANNGLDIQEFMIVPHGFATFEEALFAGAEVFHQLKKNLSKAGHSTAVGDEGGFAPNLGENGHLKALEYLMKSIETAGFKSDQIGIALDCAASEFEKEGNYSFEGKKLSFEELTLVYKNWSKRFPILSIEDGLAESDWAGWAHLTQELNSIQLVGDDLFVTQKSFLKKGMDLKVANAILVKLNQVGSVSETLETMKLARSSNYNSIVSHRSGETEDTSIAHFAVGSGCGQIKTGSMSRTDRIAKYNELLRISGLEKIEFAKPFK